MSSSRIAVVGAFVVGGVLLFGAGLFLIGDRRLLFADQMEINTAFGKVTGLQVGTKVRVAGLDAGEVLELTIPPVPSEKFRVRMRLRRDLSHLVRTDSVCAIQTDGIVGSAFIQVSPGTDAAPPVPPGGMIAGNDPVEFADVIKEGRDTFRTVAQEFVGLTHDVSETIGSLNEATQTVNTILVDADQELKKMTAAGTGAIDEIRLTLADARGVVADVKAGRGTVGQLLTDDGLYKRITGAATEVERTMGNMQAATNRVRETIDAVTARDGTAQQILTALRDTMADTREVMADMSEASEALKRNFLFRGFFRDRGFFDLDTVSRDMYQAGSLAGKDRTALKVWLDASMLFTTAPDGTEQLSADGRRRLDSAMAEFARYPRDSPLVVEGYAEATQGGEAYLTSTDRASLVRDYLLARFRRKATLTGVMPMGSLAAGSPRGDNRWAGVALALFVKNTALAP